MGRETGVRGARERCESRQGCWGGGGLLFCFFDAEKRVAKKVKRFRSKNVGLQASDLAEWAKIPGSSLVNWGRRGTRNVWKGSPAWV